MLRSLPFICLIALLSSCANPKPAEYAVTLPALETEDPYHAQYDRSALQQLKWMAGEWKGKEAGKALKQSFLFHTDHMLEVTPTEAGIARASQFFSWKDGHYYYGQNRQWIVKWISEKNIRFDPLVPGLRPMTWSRVNENKWHLLRHSEQGDELIVMERVDGVTS